MAVRPTIAAAWGQVARWSTRAAERRRGGAVTDSAWGASSPRLSRGERRQSAPPAPVTVHEELRGPLIGAERLTAPGAVIDAVGHHDGDPALTADRVHLM